MGIDEVALEERLAPLRERTDGTLYVEPAGGTFITITKTGPLIRLHLVDQRDPRTSFIQSELNLDQPLALSLPYTQAFFLTLLWNAAPARLFLAGFGGGTMALAWQHHVPAATLLCAEINRLLPPIAARFFGWQAGPLTTLQLADGRAALAAAEPVDVILIDVFEDKERVPVPFTTGEFYALCRDRLRPGGVVAANVPMRDPQFGAKLTTIQARFPHVYLCPLGAATSLVFASETALALENVAARAAALQRHFRFAFDLSPFAAELALAPAGGGRILYDA